MNQFLNLSLGHFQSKNGRNLCHRPTLSLSRWNVSLGILFCHLTSEANETTESSDQSERRKWSAKWRICEVNWISFRARARRAHSIATHAYSNERTKEHKNNSEKSIFRSLKMVAGEKFDLHLAHAKRKKLKRKWWIDFTADERICLTG